MTGSSDYPRLIPLADLTADESALVAELTGLDDDAFFDELEQFIEEPDEQVGRALYSEPLARRAATTLTAIVAEYTERIEQIGATTGAGTDKDEVRDGKVRDFLKHEAAELTQQALGPQASMLEEKDLSPRQLARKKAVILRFIESGWASITKEELLAFYANIEKRRAAERNPETVANRESRQSIEAALSRVKPYRQYLKDALKLEDLAQEIGPRGRHVAEAAAKAVSSTNPYRAYLVAKKISVGGDTDGSEVEAALRLMVMDGLGMREALEEIERRRTARADTPPAEASGPVVDEPVETPAAPRRPFRRPPAI